MAREERAVFTNLILITNEKGQILLEDRTDTSWPGVCLPGGHVEPGESFTDAAAREAYEETGLTVRNLKLCGVKQFQTKTDARYVVFFYKTNEFSGELRSSHEGRVFWASREELGQLKLVNDFMAMLKVMESDTLNEFFYYPTDDGWGLKLL